MSIILKAMVAFGIGAAAIAGLQLIGLSWIKQQLGSDAARAGLPATKPVVAAADLRKMTTPIIPKMAPIDTRAGEAAGVMAASRRVDLQVRAAQSAVPKPRTFPGVPRY
jgi:hypothetical protein